MSAIGATRTLKFKNQNSSLVIRHSNLVSFFAFIEFISALLPYLTAKTTAHASTSLTTCPSTSVSRISRPAGIRRAQESSLVILLLPRPETDRYLGLCFHATIARRRMFRPRDYPLPSMLGRQQFSTLIRGSFHKARWDKTR